jgi:hypothetical protein
MRHRDRRHLDPARSPHRNLRLSRGAKGPSCQGDPSRLLLACYDLHRELGHKVVRSLPEVFSTLGKPFAIHKADRPHVAPSALGAWTLSGRYPRPKGTSSSPSSSSIYQVDQGEGSIHDNIEDCPEILLAKHCLPIRSPVRAHS